MEIPGLSRIIIIRGRFYPQIKIKGKWITIFSNLWDGKWYEAPKGHTGYTNRVNAEITLQWCREGLMMENRRLKIERIRNKTKIKRYSNVISKTIKKLNWGRYI